jgi:hypothetical protein
VLRDELLRRVAGCLELSEGRLGALLVAGSVGAAPRADAAVAPSPATFDQGVRAERTFLVLCIALPGQGAAALSSIDPDELLTSELLRRAARHLVERTHTPLVDLPPHDEELTRVMGDLVARAGRVGDGTVERLEYARIVLELARLDRAIRRARASGEPRISDLAREREHVLEEKRKVVGRLEQAV